jgi:SulP family sulfate permease
VLIPKLATTLRGYTRAQFGADVTAGVIVGIVALPLAIAFAIASGVPPERGLWTAVIAGFIISVLGGSRVQIGGPTGAFVVIVYGIVQQHGIEGLVISTMMAGVMLIGFGMARLGAVIKFIPHPVVIGFTSGIAVVIFSSQVKDLLGLQMGEVPASFLGKWKAYAEHFATAAPAAIALAGLTLVVMLAWPRVSRRIPGPFVALIGTTVLAAALGLDVETIGQRFGDITTSLPRPHLPAVSFETFRELVGPAFTIALLGGIESLLSAVVADGMIGGNHRANMELVAQGVANIAAPLLGGMPATGAIARTATNVKNGGRTPVAGIVHAATLLAITLFFGKWVAQVPLAVLAAILVVVSYHMSEWRRVIAGLRAPKSDVVVMLVTFTLTVLIDLTIAIQVGMVLAAFLFVRRMAMLTDVSAVRRQFEGEEATDDLDTDPEGVRWSEIPAGVEVFEINGPFFFGAAARFTEAFRQIAKPPRVLILRMRHVPVMDATGLKVLTDLARRSTREGTRVLISEVRPGPALVIRRSELWDELGADSFCPSFDLAVARARRPSGEFDHGTHPLPVVRDDAAPGDH